MDELIEQVLTGINAVSRTEDAKLVEYAAEMAKGVTAEREIEIVSDLPVPYTAEVNATAQIDDEKIRVPRIATVTATKVGDAPWETSIQMRRRKREKAECAVGVHMLYESDECTAVRIVILWKRAR